MSIVTDFVGKVLGFFWKLVPKRTEYVQRAGDGGTIIVVAGEIRGDGQMSAAGGGIAEPADADDHQD